MHHRVVSLDFDRNGGVRRSDGRSVVCAVDLITLLRRETAVGGVVGLTSSRTLVVLDGDVVGDRVRRPDHKDSSPGLVGRVRRGTGNRDGGSTRLNLGNRGDRKDPSNDEHGERSLKGQHVVSP